MKYNGHELKEANGADYQLGSTPKRMLVWNSGCDYPVKGEVLGYHQGRWVESAACGIGVCSWLHAAEIPTEEETLLTNRELTKWLAQGNGEFLGTNVYVYTQYTYLEGTGNYLVSEKFKIRKFDDTEWHEPTREYAFGKENV